MFFIFAAIDHVTFHLGFFLIIYPVLTMTMFNIGVGMILSGHFGEIPEAQRNIIKLIADSAAELDALVGRLIEIAGIPESLTPGEFAMPDPTSASPSKLQ